MRGRLGRRSWAVIILAVLVNLPLVTSTIQGWQVAHSGTTVQARLTNSKVLTSDKDPAYFVAFQFDQAIDPDHGTWPAQVDRAHYQQAQRTHQVEVRVLPGHPSVYRAAGQVRGYFGLIVTLVADVALLGFVLLARRYGRPAGKPEVIRLAAIEDLTRGPSEPVLEQVEGDLYLVRGDVLERDDHEVWLDVGKDVVIVILDGHANPVGHQQPAQVRGRLIG